ncbi:MAG: outer membrane protein [Verrucomicrobiota bacterium]
MNKKQTDKCINISLAATLVIAAGLIFPRSVQAQETRRIETILEAPELIRQQAKEYMIAYREVRKQHLADHLEIGARISRFRLKKSKKQEFDKDGKFIGGFLGSIDEIDEQQDYSPTLYLRYNINKNFGLELGWDRFDIQTRTYYDTSDGDFEYSGFSFLLRGRYPNETTFTPYASLGWSLLGGDVDYNPEWHDNGRRNLYPDDTIAFSLGLGCEFELAPNWRADMGLRMIRADFDVEYKLAAERTSRGSFNFPLDNTTVHAGISYYF